MPWPPRATAGRLARGAGGAVRIRLRRELTQVLRAPHELLDVADLGVGRRARHRHVRGVQPALEAVEDPVQRLVVDPERGLVDDARQQVRARRLADDLVRHAEPRRQLPHLGLVQAEDRLDVRRAVPRLHEEPGHVLAAVGRPHDQPVLLLGDVVQGEHPEPGLDARVGEAPVHEPLVLAQARVPTSPLRNGVSPPAPVCRRCCHATTPSLTLRPGSTSRWSRS